MNWCPLWRLSEKAGMGLSSFMESFKSFAASNQSKLKEMLVTVETKLNVTEPFRLSGDLYDNSLVISRLNLMKGLVWLCNIISLADGLWRGPLRAPSERSDFIRVFLYCHEAIYVKLSGEKMAVRTGHKDQESHVSKNISFLRGLPIT